MPKSIILVIVLFLLMACNFMGYTPPIQPPIEDLPDIQLFSSLDCTTSCWQGLRPGETNSEQVRQLLDNAPFEIRRTVSDYAPFSLIFARHEQNYSISALMRDDVLFFIEIGASWLGLTIADIVSVLGTPGHASIGYDTGGEVFVLEPLMTLFYPARGYTFHLRGSDGLTIQLLENGDIEVCITEEAIISGVNVTAAGTIDEVLRYLALPFRNLTEAEVEREIGMLTAWPGFACVTVP